jgi:Trypsin-co-occurring domain 1
MAGGRPITVRVGDIELEVETVVAAGSEATAGRSGRVTASALEAFSRAQDAIVEVAKSTAAMIGAMAGAARPDTVEVEFGLKFSASGGVILAGAAGEASLTVTLGYAHRRADPALRTLAEPPLGQIPGSGELPGGPG